MPQPPPPESLDDALRRAARSLAKVSDSPRLDARVLLCAALNQSAAWLMAHGDEVLDGPHRDAFCQMLAHRAAGEPVAYILGQREFWSLDLAVSAATLIPRPDTETLVQVALRLASSRARPRILDLGTGSGAVALALAHELPAARIVATDKSADALAVARANALHLGDALQRRVTFRHGDWFDALAPDDGPFDLVVSNPPYVRRDDPHLARGDVRFEPRAALVAGADGLAEIRRIAPRSLRYLTPGGALAVEHGADQGEAVRALFGHAHLRAVETASDLAGQARVTFGRRD